MEHIINTTILQKATFTEIHESSSRELTIFSPCKCLPNFLLTNTRAAIFSVPNNVGIKKNYLSKTCFLANPQKKMYIVAFLLYNLCWYEYLLHIAFFNIWNNFIEQWWLYFTILPHVFPFLENLFFLTWYMLIAMPPL